MSLKIKAISMMAAAVAALSLIGTADAAPTKMKSAGHFIRAFQAEGLQVESVRRQGQLYLMKVAHQGVKALVAVDGKTSNIVGVNVLEVPAGYTAPAAGSKGRKFQGLTYEYGYIVEPDVYETITYVITEDQWTIVEDVEYEITETEVVTYEEVEVTESFEESISEVSEETYEQSSETTEETSEETTEESSEETSEESTATEESTDEAAGDDAAGDDAAGEEGAEEGAEEEQPEPQ